MAEIKYDYTINGKAVVMKRRVINRDGHKLFGLLSIPDFHHDMNNLVPLGIALIESWGFEGSPQNAKSYEGLEEWDEMWPLLQALAEYASARTEKATGLLADLKN